MVTDWILVRRVAAELDADLRGARITDAGVLDDGRFALQIAGRRGRPTAALAIDLFGSPPLVSWEDAELAVHGEPGWARAIAVGVRGMRIAGVRSRPGDRVLALDLGTTSRFGVTAGATLILELVPRFGNALLLRDRLIVAAAKQFSPAENEQRSVTVGGPYRPPPLPDGPPQLPRQLAGKLDEQAAAELVRAYTGERLDLGPVWVERDADGRLVNAHVVPLANSRVEHEHRRPLAPAVGRGPRGCGRAAGQRRARTPSSCARRTDRETAGCRRRRARADRSAPRRRCRPRPAARGGRRAPHLRWRDRARRDALSRP